jgi:TFIIF-interacting CTD phosphatase-like protein
MLRALRPFFELVVYTNKTKIEAEAILQTIEEKENFFTYIIPVNYCYFIEEENTFVKDLEIFFENRSEKDTILVASSPFDYALHQFNGVPIFPFNYNSPDIAL